MDYLVDEITLPESADGPGAAEFLEYAAVRNGVETHTLGTGLLAMAPPEMLAEYRDNPHRVRRHFVVRHDGGIVARGMITLRPHTPETGAYLMVDVLPAYRRRGIGSALLRTVEQVAVDAGAPVLKVAVPHSAAARGERIVPPTGFGDIAALDDGARFLASNGYALEQITRISMLQTSGLPGRLHQLQTSAAHLGGPDYRVTSWVGPTPEPRLEDLAALRTRMSTDAPSAGMVMGPDPWDAARVREHDARLATSGRTMLTAAAEHLPTGALVGFTELICAGAATVAVQEDTLVLREHRGQRLGTLVKLAAAELLGRHAPGVEAVVTWNAEENRPMLDVNEAMGFRPIGLEGSWQQRLELARE